ncbi:glycerol-3-phosphate acyltransferase [Paenibacillus nanensis]|uniref:Glycerol-3-phosphate acyltransferase n=1 Tax=Paenibacillus nanensis TaxID=393251 RepID=A0A3A1UP19_9BACL|nr:glycerol-3-phosphate acyltransferase [Paenibacillus nanensis]RIX50307.1 glycerol-3-phosphate acyltransferase [Paenibacillus nanensis]
MIILWTLIAFISGSLMFSYWLGLLAKRNLKEQGDGNPGAMNLWKAAGYRYGLAGIALDFLKGYLPILIMIRAGDISGYAVVLPSAAALLGHSFSPFLGWRGGKAIAVSFGVWSALTSFAASLAYAILLVLLLFLGRWIRKGKPATPVSDGMQVVAGMVLLAVYLQMAGYPAQILMFWLANVLVLLYTHSRELAHVRG